MIDWLVDWSDDTIVTHWFRTGALVHSANDYCQESNRSTIQVNDVNLAIADMELSEFEEEMRLSLEGIVARSDTHSLDSELTD
jgi:hypothetical protein